MFVSIPMLNHHCALFERIVQSLANKMVYSFDWDCNESIRKNLVYSNEVLPLAVTMKFSNTLVSDVDQARVVVAKEIRIHVQAQDEHDKSLQSMNSSLLVRIHRLHRLSIVRRKYSAWENHFEHTNNPSNIPRVVRRLFEEDECVLDCLNKQNRDELDRKILHEGKKEILTTKETNNENLPGSYSSIIGSG